MSLISVIVTTYNWKSALTACIQSLWKQNDLNFEIIIADDGSKDTTTELIKQLAKKSPVPLKHCFHDDKGFRAGTIRNQAAESCDGDYLIFIDGDCVVFPHFIHRHRQLAQQNYFVAGNRILLNKAFTKQVLKSRLPLHNQATSEFIKWRFQGHINRLLPLIYIPFNFFRHLHPKRWKKAMTCNLALWKKDFYTVNGFDALFEGWGYEDSDLVIRLIHAGIKRKEGRFAVPVLHLWHHQNDRSAEPENYQRLMTRLKDPEFRWATQGITESPK
ncbi:MAG: glycosyltransferase family 2 protein [Methylococcales bacterium]|nr:glycosyltransferase family 2 protein [Methylococcales bacterium]MCK5925503.1 glycosyltransferase family 2 protein [Methylococcales bacterium]